MHHILDIRSMHPCNHGFRRFVSVFPECKNGEIEINSANLIRAVEHTELDIAFLRVWLMERDRNNWKHWDKMMPYWTDHITRLAGNCIIYKPDKAIMAWRQFTANFIAKCLCISDWRPYELVVNQIGTLLTYQQVE